MIKQMAVGFCWGLMLLWTLGVDFESTCTGKLKVSRIVPRLWRWVYKILIGPIILYVEHGGVVITVGSQSEKSQFEAYG